MAYDIGEAFQKIEEEMIASMSRNLKRHLETEKKEGLNYSMWQAEQLAALNNFRKDNKKTFSGYFSTINGKIADVLQKANESGQMMQETTILEAIRDGAKIYNYEGAKSIRAQFFKINERKMNALIEATQNDMAKAETAMLRMANDEYRKVIYNSQVFYNSGVGTLSQCVDMATKDFLAKGISCIEYANGARVGIDVYSRMALRTAQTRAYLQGEATKRDEWGVNTVMVNRRGVACPKCLQWVGKVYYDDVWGNIPVPSPEKYPRLSKAIAGGLYHPNCKDIHTTYFEDVSRDPKPMTQKEIDEANRVYALEQRQRYNERQIRKYKRLVTGSVDPENIAKYTDKLRQWQTIQKEFVSANSDVLKRRPELEKIFDAPPNLQSVNTPAQNHDIIKHKHTWVESITKKPTCIEDGEKTLTCSCGKEKTESIPALGHDLVYDVHPPTCTEEGYTEVWCKRCYKVIDAKTDIKPALGHDWGPYVIVKQPTVTANGRKEKICARCGKKNHATIPKLKAKSPSVQIKALEDSIKQIDTDIAALNSKSYNNIWPDPVTVSDYSAKKNKIAAKKQWYLDKISAGDTTKDWQQYIDLVDEFEAKGKEYENLLVQKQQNQDALDLLRPRPQNDAFTPDAYSKARKDAALWSDDKSYVDSKVRDKSGEVWRNSTQAQRDAAYKYTAGSGSFNRPLRGYDGSWYDYKGPGKVDLNREGSGKAIEELTKMIDKSTYDHDMWLQRGVYGDGATSFLGLNSGDLSRLSQSELETKLLGTVREDLAFMSTGAAKGQGFSGDLILNIYAPKGTKMLYCEPFSRYGNGAGKGWDGIKTQYSFGSEFEMLIQRGTKFKITKVEKPYGTVYVDVEVIGQI